MTLSISDPPSPPSGTILIFDIASFSSARIYTPGSDAAHPAFMIDSDQNGKRCRLHVGAAPDGAVVGEFVLHGMLKKGLGMVTVAGTPIPIPIEEWAQIERDRETLTVHESLHSKPCSWSLRPMDSNNKNMNGGPVQIIYDARRDGVVVATWYSSHTHQQRSGDEITTTLVRSHIAFADKIKTNESTVPDLLLPLMVLKALHVRKAGSSFDGMSFGLFSVFTQ